ncbi:MAG TPA: peptidylprolyl isomerase, partial [Alphaproteobacteria bacterium]|nr:peptidylprolyl isomerase [Alphaproteobacteria bacterium]
VATAPAATAPAVQAPAAPVKQPEPTFVVAEFSGVKITFAEVQSFLSTLPEELKAVPLDRIYEAVVRRIVDAKILTKAATDAGLAQDPEVKKQQELATEAVLQKSFLDRENAKRITDPVLKAKYDEILATLPKGDKAPKEVRLRRIVTQDAAAAQKMLDTLKKAGADFATTAQAGSIDAQTKDQGGDMGYFPVSELPEEIAKEVKTAKAATLVSKVITIANGNALFPKGSYVLKVEDQRAMEPPAFDAVKGELKQALAPEYAGKVIEELRQKSSVKVFGMDGQEIVKAPAAATPEAATPAAN